MKKQIITALAIVLTFAAHAQTNTEQKESKIGLNVNGKLGFARLKQTDFAPLNGNINGADVLLSFKLGKKWDIATGLGYSQLNANATISGNTASLQNSYLQIPAKIIGDFTVFNNEQSVSRVYLNLAAGIYANTLLKSEVETISGNSTTKNMGWNFGVATQVGLKFIVSDIVDVGIGLESQSDFSKMKKDGFEQRIEQINAFYFNLGYKF